MAEAALKTRLILIVFVSETTVTTPGFLVSWLFSDIPYLQAFLWDEKPSLTSRFYILDIKAVSFFLRGRKGIVQLSWN